MKKLKINKIISGIIILVLVLIGLYYLYHSLTPCLLSTPKQDFIWINIHGKVLPHEDVMNLYIQDKESYKVKRPSKIGVYLYDPLKRGIPEGEKLGGSEIKWINDTLGEYNIPLKMVYPLSVIVKIYGNYANYSFINFKLNEIEKESDVYWGLTDISVEKKRATEDFEKETKIAEIDLSNAQGFFYNAGIPPSESEYTEITEYLQRADSYMRERRVDNETMALMDVLYTHFYAERAYYSTNLYKLKNCIRNINETLKRYNDSLCYLPSYDSIKKFEIVKDKYTDYTENSITRERAEDYDLQKRDKLIEKINQIYKFNHEYGYAPYELISECKDAFENLNETFAFQSPYCQKRKDVIFLFKWSSLILPIVIVFLLSIFLEAHLKITEKIDKELSKVEETWGKLEPLPKALLYAGFISLLVLTVLFLLLMALFSRYIDQVTIFSLTGLFTVAIFKYLVDHKKEQYQKK